MSDSLELNQNVWVYQTQPKYTQKGRRQCCQEANDFQFQFSHCLTAAVILAIVEPVDTIYFD